MNSLGYDRPLYILPFDHRGSFHTELFGWKGLLTSEQTAQIAATKRAIYDAAKVAVDAGAPKEKTAILTDEQFGTDVLRDAAAEGYLTACPAEKSGQDEFDFEFGDLFAQHIEKFHPTFCKVQVRYNPRVNHAFNRRQSARLRKLSDYLHAHSTSLLMCELLVPPTDQELKPQVMAEAIRALQESGVESDVWTIEGLDRREDAEKIVAAAHRDGRHKVGCVLVGRGEDDAKVHEWLTMAASVPGFVGFAVGRAIFWDSLVAWRQKKLTREAAVAEMARRFHELVNIFEKAAVAA